MTLKTYFEKISVEKVFLFIFGIWFIDFLTTVIALNTGNFVEANLIAKVFFDMGVKGYFYLAFNNALGLLGLSYLCIRMRERIKSKSTKIPSWIIPGITIIAFVGAELGVIIHNVILLLR